MSGWYKQAADKLAAEMKAGGFDKKATSWNNVWADKRMASAVRDTLLEFCRQDEEFAQAVVQGGKFIDCMKAVGELVRKDEISDMKAYGEAVKFYFPGAAIRVTMEIDLLAEVRQDGDHLVDANKKAEGLLIDLSDFF